MAQQFDVEVHGRKRPAEGEPDDQPLAKRFGRLQIDTLATLRLSEIREEQARLDSRFSKPNDVMMLDDTKTTIYIHDLEQELADSEALDGPLTILPGIEDRLSMPMMLVSSTKQGNELVLYREPESLSIPKEKDQVRRALIETRERARLRQSRYHLMRDTQERNDSHPTRRSLDVINQNCGHKDADGDNMDIDTEACT